MSRRKAPEGRSGKEARFVRLYHWMMDTAAWQALNGNERAIYVDMARRYAGTGTTNGKIRYAVRDATKALRIGKTTAARSIARLQECGFIVSTRKGHFDWKIGHASEWRLTEFPCDVTNELASKEFARWQSKNLEPVPETGPDGTCSGTVRYLRRDRALAKVH